VDRKLRFGGKRLAWPGPADCRSRRCSAPGAPSARASDATSSSWLNQVEGFFALITERKIGRGSYRSAMALRAEITSFIEHHNATPSRSDGQNKPTIFSAPSNASVLTIRQPELESDELLVLDTSGRSYSATATFE
jgi:hypothetical protein